MWENHKKKGKLTELAIRERGWTIYLDYLKAYLMFGKDMRTERASKQTVKN